jgi:hypothetical protein
MPGTKFVERGAGKPLDKRSQAGAEGWRPENRQKIVNRLIEEQVDEPSGRPTRGC